MDRPLAELSQLQSLLETHSLPHLEVKTLTEVPAGKNRYPVLGFCLGNPDPTAPCFALVAGVHGLEKIGTQVLLSCLHSLFTRLSWDEQLQELFQKIRIVSIPILNPGGMALHRRSNPRGVDLMRNAPIEAEETPLWLAGGHRFGPHLPWYRGPEGEPMEAEAQALVDFLSAKALPSHLCLALDFHSGFGWRDRLWYPFAKTKKPFPRQKEALQFKALFDRTYPYHFYRVESQSESYTTHGDLWDYLYEIHENGNPQNDRLFLPWTLEMGSWMWLKKNPLQLFQSHGLFHPIKPHRFDRVLRRHLTLFDFFLRALANPGAWQ